ncbi:MAG: hypothetical protein ABW047_10465 [Nitrospiraceae bacterium]
MRRALGIDSNLTYLYEKLGDVARMRGDEAGAIREFRQAIGTSISREVLSAGSALEPRVPVPYWIEPFRAVMQKSPI